MISYTLLPIYVMVFGLLVISQRIPRLEQFVADVTFDAAMLDMARLHVVKNVALEHWNLSGQNGVQIKKSFWARFD